MKEDIRAVFHIFVKLWAVGLMLVGSFVGFWCVVGIIGFAYTSLTSPHRPVHRAPGVLSPAHYCEDVDSR